MARAPFQVLIYPYRRTDTGEFEYALFKRSDHGYWQAVAGGGEEGESPLEAARREAFEEANISSDSSYLVLQTVESVPVTEFRDSYLWGEETYVIPQYYFGVLAASGEIRISHEHTHLRWFSYFEAYQILNYESDRTALWELNCRLIGIGPRDEPRPKIILPPSQSMIFLKLGGSLITVKAQPHTARIEVLTRLADEIAAALSENASLRLVLGHGSGSFGHVPAKKYGTRQGVHNDTEWQGFSEVWYEASSLNRMVIEALHQAGLPAISFPPSAAVIAQEGHIVEWNLAPLESALGHGLLPVIYGDVVFDTSRGGTILSTEDLFGYLAHKLHPSRILLAGLEEGVWEDYPLCTRLIPKITTKNFPQLKLTLRGSAGTDVTGGMESKVRQTLALLEEIPNLHAWIFSGAESGNVLSALLGDSPGTQLVL
jgi:isopentenyl phosphate kinase